MHAVFHPLFRLFHFPYHCQFPLVLLQPPLLFSSFSFRLRFSCSSFPLELLCWSSFSFLQEEHSFFVCSSVFSRFLRSFFFEGSKVLPLLLSFILFISLPLSLFTFFLYFCSFLLLYFDLLFFLEPHHPPPFSLFIHLPLSTSFPLFPLQLPVSAFSSGRGY